MAGKVAVGLVALAMRHGLSGISIYGLNGLEREMSIPPTLHWSNTTFRPRPET